METNRIDRRRVLKGAAGIGLASLATPSILTACTTEGSSSANHKATAALPSYVPFDDVKADLPATADGVMASYFAYPSEPVKASEGTPAKGGSISILAAIEGAVPPALDRNRFWQEANRRIGAELAFNMVPSIDYAKKFAVSMAGNDVADLTLIVPSPQMPQLLASKFQDLSEYLSGDKIKDYPALASIPTIAWKSTLFGDGVWGVPLNRPVIANEMLVRQDLVDAASGPKEPGSADEFFEFCKSVTQPAKQQWASGSPYVMTIFAREMFGVANTWRKTDGKFQFWIEDDKTKDALSFVARMWKEGLFHPDATATPGKVAEWFGTGRIVLNNNGAGAGPGSVQQRRAETPQFDVGYLPPPKHDGTGHAAKFLGKAVFWRPFVAMKKGTPDRVRELLSVLNWIASPFGSQEYLFVNYGLADVHHTLKGSDPIKTPTGTTELTVPVRYLAQGAAVTYSPGIPEAAQTYYDFQKKVIPTGITPANIGLYSETDQNDGPTLDQPIDALITDMAVGRKTLADWDDAVAAWRRNGGDKIRGEYEKSFADAN